jgi:hypothetical protein
MLLEMLYFLLACKIFFGHLQSTKKIYQLYLERIHLLVVAQLQVTASTILTISFLNW